MIQELIEVKQKIKELTAEKDRLEEAIIESVKDELPEEGAVTKEIEGVKVKINRGITRKIDPTGAKELYNLLDSNLYPFTWSKEPKLDIKKFRYLQANEPGVMKLLSKAITEKPRKISVTINN